MDNKIKMEIVTINNSNIDDIQNHFDFLPKEYIKSIKDRTDINEYLNKIYNLAERYEIWDKKDLIAFVAVYINKGITVPAYITNVSIVKDKQGLGLAKRLLKYLIEDLTTKKYKKIELEVKEDNKPALSLYRSFGFIKQEDKSNQGYFKMVLNL